MLRTAIILNFLLVIGLGMYIFLRPSSGKTVFVLNNEVFAGFKGKQILEDKMKMLQTNHKRELDSLSVLVQQGSKPELLQHYKDTEESYRILEQELSEQYTADIWKRINAYLVDFGKAKGYNFILGANGNGNLMYANDGVNVTKEAVEYINMKFEADD
jgi:outer membrane protein